MFPPILVALALYDAQPLNKNGVGFQSFILGQSIEDARKAPLPGTQKLICSDDPRPPHTFVPFVMPTPDEDGLIRCAPSDYWLPVTSDIRARVSLEFVDGSLAAIDADYFTTSAPIIEQAMIEKYGKPFEEKVGTVQTVSGATFSQKIVTWHIDGNIVQLYNPSTKIDLMTVFYRSPVSEEFYQRVKRKAAKGANL